MLQGALNVQPSNPTAGSIPGLISCWWQGAAQARGSPSRSISNSMPCVLQSFKVPLNGTFIFLPAEEKALLNSQAGKLEFTQMEQLAQTAEQIPVTNQFHTSKERKKGMAEAGQSKQALENSNPLAGIFSCYFSHSGFFGDLSIQQSREGFCIHMKWFKAPGGVLCSVPATTKHTLFEIL